LSFSAAEDLSLNLTVTKSDALSDAVKVNTMVYNLGVDYKYTAHVSFQAGYNFTDSKTPSAPTSSYNSNTFTLSAAFRY
jgi:long-subunit fatty acid transport protein